MSKAPTPFAPVSGRHSQVWLFYCQIESLTLKTIKVVLRSPCSLLLMTLVIPAIVLLLLYTKSSAQSDDAKNPGKNLMEFKLDNFFPKCTMYNSYSHAVAGGYCNVPFLYAPKNAYTDQVMSAFSRQQALTLTKDVVSSPDPLSAMEYAYNNPGQVGYLITFINETSIAERTTSYTIFVNSTVSAMNQNLSPYGKDVGIAIFVFVFCYLQTCLIVGIINRYCILKS